MTTIFAIDPGKTVGIAVGHTFDEPPWADQVDFFEFGDWLEYQLSLYYNTHKVIVTCERFIVTHTTARKSSDANWALEIIGVSRYLARKYSFDFKQWGASEAKTFTNDAHLREIKWWRPGKGHANDATRHFILCGVETQGWMPPWLVAGSTEPK